MGILIPILIILGLLIAIAAAIILTSRARQGQRVPLSFRVILLSYFYLMSLISLVVLASGLVPLFNAGLSTVLGKEFSYGRLPFLPRLI